MPRIRASLPRHWRRGLPPLVVAGTLLTPLSPLVPHPVAASATATVSALAATFYPNPSNSGSFDPSQLSSPAFTQTVPVVDFNPSVTSQSTFCSNVTGVTDSTRPFTDVVPNGDGTCSTLAAQGGGQQAGVGNLFTFEGSLLGTLTVPIPGNLTMTFSSDDGWILGFGPVNGGTGQPQHFGGAWMNPPAATPVKSYQVAGAANLSPPTRGNQVIVYFPAAGTYPMEIDYSECCGGPLQLLLNPGTIAPAAARLGSDLWGTGSRGSAAAPPCFQGDPVNCDTGNLVETVGDLRATGRGRPLDLSRSYNSFDAVAAGTPHRFGYGWTDSYAVGLTLDSSWSPAQASVHTEDGSTIRFQANGSGGYDPVGPWVIARLTPTANQTYTYTLPDQTVDVFNAAGSLISERDRDGVTTILTYGASGPLTSVTDAAGRSLTFTTGASGLVTRVTATTRPPTSSR